MLAIQAILIGSFTVVLLRFISNPYSSITQAWKKIAIAVFALVAVCAILFPSLTNDLAHAVGVSRGADLLLYLETIVLIFVCLNFYIQGKRDQQRLATLTRRMAILEASVRHKKSGKTPK